MIGGALQRRILLEIVAADDRGDGGALQPLRGVPWRPVRVGLAGSSASTSRALRKLERALLVRRLDADGAPAGRASFVALTDKGRRVGCRLTERPSLTSTSVAALSGASRVRFDVGSGESGPHSDDDSRAG